MVSQITGADQRAAPPASLIAGTAPSVSCGRILPDIRAVGAALTLAPQRCRKFSQLVANAAVPMGMGDRPGGVLTFAFRLCHWPGVNRSESGIASRSFIIALAAVGVGLLGYAAWAFLRPDPYSLSERIVRDARRGVAAEVRESQRQIDDIAREAKRDNKDVPAEVEKIWR
jgi:hypothetical protein